VLLDAVIFHLIAQFTYNRLRSSNNNI
jgi:hypothetical protein